MNIVGLNGSLRPGSVTGQMIDRVLNAAAAEGAKTDHISLTGQNIPPCDARPDGTYGPVVDTLEQRLRKADVVVLGTPEYRGGYSGVLKNFLDVVRPDTLNGKWVALVGAAGGRLGAEAALNQLRIVMKNMNAVVWPVQTSATGKDVIDGTLADQEVIDRLETTGRDIVWTLDQPRGLARLKARLSGLFKSA